MNQLGSGYTERSWAIDLIGHIKQLALRGDRPIKDAGGEQTIRAEGGVLFPDVLLFGDKATARILQGWELKLPDTSIHDTEFRKNAELKACALGLDSFLLWNVTNAQLYVKHPETQGYIIEKSWSDLSDITSRSSVVSNRHRWERLATEIVAYLNDLFERGALEGRPFIESYRTGGITALVLDNTGIVEAAIHHATLRNSQLRAEVTLWWGRYQTEYLGTTAERVLAQAVLSNWISKILFAHILRETDSRAQRVADIQEGTTPEEALQLFRQLSQDCNFWTIFSDSIALSTLPDKPWRELKQFNQLLADLRVGSVDQIQLGRIFEATVEVARRKLRGQYPTPIPLARLLVNLCVRDILNDRVLDPCCGSGTIARAALEQKLRAGVTPEKAAACVFAGDHDPQAVQIATFAMANPRLMNLPLRLFQRDVFFLEPTTEIEFRNPIDGTPFVERLGQFEVIAANLPFVPQSEQAQYGTAIDQVADKLPKDGQILSRRADVAAYLPFAIYPLLRDSGRLGIVITNAWLGTDWGDAFYDSLGQYYDLKSVITSGAGRWFQNSDVVANILVLEKKEDPERVNSDVKFVVLRRPLEELQDEEDQRIAAAQIELGQTQFETMSIRAVSPTRLSRFRTYGLGGNAQFVNSDWVLDLPLVRLSDRFCIRRGERRGMNTLFYPTGNHGIETEYIRPLVKSPTDFVSLIDSASKEAFSCSRSEPELRELGHKGALNWIKRFQTPETVDRLSRSNTFWYEMNTDNLTELVMFINYGERLFVGRLNPPAFVDQRMVRLLPKGDIDIGLYHALLNCCVGMFVIEGMGFGRGLGALDLNKDRIEAYMNMLDLEVLDEDARTEIRRAFEPMLYREILGVADELEQADRQLFDDTVIRAFGLRVQREHIYENLRELVEIRTTANNYQNS